MVGLVLSLVGGLGCGRVGFDHFGFLCSGVWELGVRAFGEQRQFPNSEPEVW